jgi:hypothetical protein
METKSLDWQTAAQAYLERLGAAEWKAQGCPIPSKRSRSKRFRPSQYMEELTRLLGENNEEGFKALKMLEGYASALES